MRLRYSMVIFDCDSVLVDGEPLSCEVLAAGLREHGLEVDVEYVAGAFPRPQHSSETCPRANLAITD